jgi:hypothetical protein
VHELEQTNDADLEVLVRGTNNAVLDAVRILAFKNLMPWRYEHWL